MQRVAVKLDCKLLDFLVRPECLSQCYRTQDRVYVIHCSGFFPSIHISHSLHWANTEVVPRFQTPLQPNSLYFKQTHGPYRKTKKNGKMGKRGYLCKHARGEIHLLASLYIGTCTLYIRPTWLILHCLKTKMYMY